MVNCIKRIFESIIEQKNLGCDSRTKCLLNKGFADKIYSNIKFEELLKIFSKKNLLYFFTKNVTKPNFWHYLPLPSIFWKHFSVNNVLKQLFYHQFRCSIINSENSNSTKTYLGIHIQNKCHMLIAFIDVYLNAENQIQISIQWINIDYGILRHASSKKVLAVCSFDFFLSTPIYIS